MTISAKSTALLIIAHGSRNPEANGDLFFVVGEMARRGAFPIVEGAFLDLAQPDIPKGGASCVARGAEKVILLPYFLSPGIHAVQDLRDFRDKLEARFPGVVFTLGDPLGRHPLLLEILHQRAWEALSPSPKRD